MACMALLLPTPASAQLGRLIETSQLVPMFNRVCVRNAPTFAARIPAIARAEKWDELKTSPTAKAGDRGWLVSIKGQPSIVDIGRISGGERCSVNAVGDPNAIMKALSQIMGTKPATSNGPNRTQVRSWGASKGRPAISVTSSPGQAMARLTATAVAK